ncbi:DnaK family member protein [Theileria equi strain WA]|uniref:DnaK family member protein n=1 Tax=Theileria equi strain WA TaxID=1537102 RepID=L0AXS8_THEEQ|nr:DnaK family member protein [Theileria equi strain WA]AFZ80058.1 DnaK family member protein [Theileria equi strain WA]|eukprot:XP_004829724.1 DnaK family member protein [Theileria equi strain WA]
MLSSPSSRKHTGTFRGLGVLLAIALLISCCSATTATLGIDWGEEFVKVSIAFRGHRPDILLTSSGSRKFQNVVYLSGETRLFDKEASAYVLRDPARTLQKSAHILGVPFQGLSLSKSNAVNPTEVVETFRKNDISFNWDYTPYEFAVAEDGQLQLKLLKDANVSVEEVYAHFFNHIKDVALEKLHSVKIIDSLDSKAELLAVISVPCNYTQNQRKAIAFAAESAGLKVVDLVHGITAAALLHSLEMQPGTKKVLFYDMGSSAANVGVVEIFVPSTGKGAGRKNPYIKTLSCVTVPGVGGRHHDHLLSEHLREAFEKEHSLKLMPAYPKSVQKLARAVNKAKTTLSISTSTNMEVENLVPDKTLKAGTITRDLFDQLLQPIVNKLDEPVPKALELAGVKMEEVDAVELIGGSWRVPVIQKKIAETVTPHQLGFHLNAEESVAMGAGYLGAAHNPFFRMKKVDIMDNSVFDYVLHIVSGKDANKAIDKKVVLHSHSSKLSATKTVKLKSHFDLEVELFEGGVSIAHYNVSGIESLLKDHPDKVAEVSLVFKANLGIIKLDQTFAVVVDASSTSEDAVESDEGSADGADADKEQEVKNDAPKTETEEAPKGDAVPKENESTEGQSETKDASQEAPKDGQADKAEPSNGQDEAKPEKGEETKETPKTDTKEAAKKEEKKNVLTFSVTQSQVYGNAKLESCRDAIAELVKRDKALYARSDAKNQLESLIYKYKGKVNSKDFKDATTEDVHAKFSARIEELLTWFDINSSSASLEQFNEITKELNDVATPIFVRMGHNSDRESVIKSTDREFDKLKKKFDELIAERPYLLEHQGIINTFNNLVEWWEQAKKDQEARPLNQDPVFTFETVKPKRSAAKLALKTIEAIKPKVVEPPKPETEEAPKGDAVPKENESTEGQSETKDASQEAPKDGQADKAEPSNGQDEAKPEKGEENVKTEL